MAPSRTTGARTSVWMLAALALPAGVWLLRVLWVGRRFTVLSYDLRMYFYPTYHAFYGRLAAGILPLWNPHQLCGLPWLGTLQAGFFYPPHVLYLILPTHLALAACALLHLTLLAFTTALFARRAGLAAPGAALAAVLFTARGPIQEWVLFPYLLEAIAWLPLGCLAVLGLASGEGRRALGLLAVATAMSLLAGSPQASAFALYAWSSLLLAKLIDSGGLLRRWGVAGGRFAAALALGALIAAVQLVPAAEMASVGNRPTRELQVEKMFVFGNPAPAILRQAIAGSDSPLDVLVLALLPAAMLAGRHRALRLWALAVGILAFVFALGPGTGLFWLYRALPGLAWFRTPNRILVLSHFASALLAGIALDALATDLPAAAWRRRRAVLRASSAAAALLLAGYLAWRGAQTPAVIALVTAGALLLRLDRAPAPLAAFLLVLAVVEAIFALPRERLPYDASSAAPYRAQSTAYAEIARRQASDRVWVVSAGLDPQLAVRLASWYGLRAIDDYEPLMLRRQAEYFTFVREGSIDPPGVTFQGSLVTRAQRTGASVARRRRLLDLAALRLVAVDSSLLRLPEVGAAVAAAGFERRSPLGPRLALFENARAVPRAFVVYRALPAPRVEQLLERMSAPDFDPLVASYVEGDPGLVPASTAPERGSAATFVRDEAGVVELEATLAAPGLVVLADSYYPAWRASVDGVSAPILATNHLFRGVRVPAGRHRVRFEYGRQSLLAAAAVSLAALIVVGALVVWP